MGLEKPVNYVQKPSKILMRLERSLVKKIYFSPDTLYSRDITVCVS